MPTNKTGANLFDNWCGSTTAQEVIKGGWHKLLRDIRSLWNENGNWSQDGDPVSIAKAIWEYAHKLEGERVKLHDEMGE